MNQFTIWHGIIPPYDGVHGVCDKCFGKGVRHNGYFEYPCGCGLPITTSIGVDKTVKDVQVKIQLREGTTELINEVCAVIQNKGSGNVDESLGLMSEIAKVIVSHNIEIDKPSNSGAKSEYYSTKLPNHTFDSFGAPY